ncbi:hypothetical protein POM88_000970 [Heracleum sosnowskyi]|uniref:PHD finger protein ALFIN-LIKE n=1 Tax=Heracleum sosnowskyi TaxID=360622 RepID=A0AAD8JF88_9APIA|nr:hypothetical protein POM88_000970 [Heracleum sosnowskyi]
MVFHIGKELRISSWVKKFVTGPLQNLFEIDVLQFFEDAIISWGLPWDTNIYHVKRNESLPMSDLVPLLEPKMDQSYIHVEMLFDVPGGQPFYPRSVMEVFRDFEDGRASLIRSLTSEEKKCITLYGLPSNEWKTEERVRPVGRDQSSGVKVLRQPPKPKFGFHFAEKVMEEYDWLSFAASQGDGWLTSNASHFVDLYGFNLADRQRLFTIMNDLSTVHEVVTEATKNLQLKDEDGEDSEAVDDKDEGATICETCGES